MNILPDCQWLLYPLKGGSVIALATRSVDAWVGTPATPEASYVGGLQEIAASVEYRDERRGRRDRQARAHEQGGRDVIQHIVVLKLKAGTTDAQVEEVFAQAGQLVDGIDGVERITLGRNRGEAEHGYTHAFIVNLHDDEALTEYLNHPVRQRYVTDVLGPIEEERIEIEVPGDGSDLHTRRASLGWEWGATRHSASAVAAALRWEEKER
jgi:heme-degrading monooxygenase HmoA